MHRYISNASQGSAWRCLLALGALLLTSGALAREAAPLTWPAATLERTAFRERCAILIHRGPALDAGAVLSGRHAADFVAATSNNTNLGFTDAEVWLRFAVRYTAQAGAPPVLVLPKALIDHVELFSIDSAGTITHALTGDAHTFATRPIAYRGFAFLLTPEPDATVTYYLRVRSETGAIGLPLELQDGATFHARSAVENYRAVSSAAAADVIRRADEALYRSKREGRDRLTVDSLSLVVANDGERRLEKPPPRP